MINNGDCGDISEVGIGGGGNEEDGDDGDGDDTFCVSFWAFGNIGNSNSF